MNLPDTLFYYYEATRAPFLSISELASTEFRGLMDRFSEYGIRIIEAQVWDLSLLEPYIEAARP